MTCGTIVIANGEPGAKKFIKWIKPSAIGIALRAEIDFAGINNFLNLAGAELTLSSALSKGSVASRRAFPDNKAPSAPRNSRQLGFIPNVATVAFRKSPKATTGVESGTTSAMGAGRRTISKI